jgi:hypothetical protein
VSTWRFSEQNLAARKGTMGEIAEAVFEATYPQGWCRWGIDRPPIQVAKVPAFVRFAPDYLTSKGFVEVQGFGKDQKIKLKHAKYDALNEWHGIFRVDLFFYDSHNSRYGFVRLHDFIDAYEEHGYEGAFDDGLNPFMGLKAEHLPVDRWVEWEPADG